MTLWLNQSINKMRKSLRESALIILSLFYCINTSISQVLTPPYFNLAYGRPIVATATCGEGVSEPELFCKLTGANHEHETVQPNFSVIQGQLCDECKPGSGDQQAHPASQAVDGTEKWWQSPPLSRGPQFNQVNLTLDLQQVGIHAVRFNSVLYYEGHIVGFKNDWLGIQHIE